MSGRRTLIAVLAGVLALFAGGGAASAKPKKHHKSKGVAKKDDPGMAVTKKHYQAGNAHCDLQEYDAAVAEYREAYLLTGDPALLYNMGQGYRLGGRKQEAVTSYRGFLEAAAQQPIEKRNSTVEMEVQ